MKTISFILKYHLVIITGLLAIAALAAVISLGATHQLVTFAMCSILAYAQYHAIKKDEEENS